TRPVASLETTLNGLVQLAERLDDEVEDGRPNLANFAKLPIGQPLPCISDAIDGPIPSARERLLNLLDGSGPVGVPQPFPTGAQNVDCPIPCIRQPITQVADGLRHSWGVLVQPIPGFACLFQRPTPRVAQPTG